MVIRTAQFEGMQDRAHDEYLDTLARDVGSRFPAELAKRGLEGPRLKAALRIAISDARQYGIEEAADLQLYADCVALLGPGFDKDPSSAWTGEILERDDLNGTAKMDEINEQLLFRPGGPR